MPDDDLPAYLDEHFSTLRSQVTTLVPVPAPEKIMERGRRRRQLTRALVTGIAVVSAVGAGYALTANLRGPGQPRSVAAGPLAPPAYAPPAGAFRQVAGAAIPVGFLPLEGRAVATRPGLGSQCPGGTVPSSDSEIIASQSLRDTAGGQVSLFVYAAGLVASRAYDEYVAEVGRCRTAGDRGLSWHKQTEPMRYGAAAIRVTTTYDRRTGDRSVPPDTTEVALRYGASLLLVSGPDRTAVDRVWGGLHDRLCAFARDCRPRAGRPAALELSTGGAAWAVVLATDSSGDEASLGRAVARAAEYGYRASISSVDCDEGARAGLGLPAEKPYRYVAVYFGSRTDADAFAASAEHPTTPGATATHPVATVSVNTYCLG